MKIYIMRGLPGSGKSTWVLHNLGKKCEVCSADHYHMVNGVCIYKKENAAMAHNVCLRSFAEQIFQSAQFWDSEKVVCVDNTNTTVAEIAPYYRLAEAYGYNPEIIFINCSLEVAIARNVHKVPEQTIYHMMQNLWQERIPLHWRQTIVNCVP